MKRAGKRPKQWPSRLIQVTIGLMVSGLAIGGIIAVSNLTRDTLGQSDRYLLPFTEIECESPSGLEKNVFLGEVQYIGRFHDKLDILDPSLPEKLRIAFRDHKRVQTVEKLEILPPKRIIVRMTFK